MASIGRCMSSIVTFVGGMLKGDFGRSFVFGLPFCN